MLHIYSTVPLTPDREATVLGSAELPNLKWSASGTHPTSADRQTNSGWAVSHWKTVSIRPTTSLYPGPGGGSLLFQGPYQRSQKYQGGNEANSDICQVIFHPDELIFSPFIPTGNAGKTDPSAGVGATPAYQAPTKTATPKISTQDHWGG